jgi:hypothetical protein
MGKTKKGTGPTISETLARQEHEQVAQLARVAMQKMQAGQSLTIREQGALRKWESAQLEKWGLQYVAAVPKKDYCDHVGLHQKVALEQSRKFGLPYHTSGSTVNLFEILGAWHAWAADNKHVITRAIRANHLDEEEFGDDTAFAHWDTRRIRAITLLKEAEYEEKLGKMQPIELVQQLLLMYYVRPMLRRIESLEKKEDEFASEVAESLRQDIKEFELGLEMLFSDGDDLSPAEEPNSAA